MEQKELKKVLAGFCIAGLIAGSTAVLPGCMGSSGCGDKKTEAGSSQSG